MSLEKSIREFNQELMKQVPDEAATVMQGAIQRLHDAGIEAKALKVGDKTPNFYLPMLYGKKVYSKSLLAKGPLVINFYRGERCPNCNLELKAFQDVLSEINALGAELVAISPNLPDSSLLSI